MMRLAGIKGEAGEVEEAGKDQILIQLVHPVEENELYPFILVSVS